MVDDGDKRVQELRVMQLEDQRLVERPLGEVTSRYVDLHKLTVSGAHAKAGVG